MADVNMDGLFGGGCGCLIWIVLFFLIICCCCGGGGFI
jgi:hypothetical protein